MADPTAASLRRDAAASERSEDERGDPFRPPPARRGAGRVPLQAGLRRGVPALSKAAGWRRAGKVNRKRAELVAGGDSQVTPGNRGACASLAGLAPHTDRHPPPGAWGVRGPGGQGAGNGEGVC